MNFRVVVFDLDGTLVDSKIDFAAMRSDLQISEAADILGHIETLHPRNRADALDIVYRHEKVGVDNSVAIEGALDFVTHAKSFGRDCAVFTRNSNVLAHESLKIHGFEIDIVVAREDAPPKPKPDGLIKIAEMFQVEITDILFIGDYLYDLQAGLAAGVSTALYLPAPADFDTSGASFVFNSYQSFKNQMFL